MKKTCFLILAMCLVFLAACRQSTEGPSGTENSGEAPRQTTETTGTTEAAQQTDITTQPTEISASPTADDNRNINTREFFVYDEKYNYSYYKGHGIDMSQCVNGNCYSVDKETKEIIWLYDSSLISKRFGQQIREAYVKIDGEWQYGKYIYYILQAEPNTIYRMDYLGNVRDERVYESEMPLGEIYDFLVTFRQFGQDVLVVQSRDQIIVVDTAAKTGQVVTRDQDMDDLSSLFYSAKGELIIVYNTFYPDGPEGEQSGRRYYNVATGETTIWFTE